MCVRLITLMIIPIPVLLACSCSRELGDGSPVARSDATKRLNPNILLARPDPLEIGKISAGQSLRRTVEVSNPSDRPHLLENVSTSCPCVHIEGTPVTIQPRHSIHLEIGIDTATEPDFRGSLAVELRGRTQNETTLFRMEVRFSVIDASSQDHQGPRGIH